MNLEPTSDQRIFQTQWFVNPKQPLIETKVFYAKLDNLLYYTTAHRGPTTDDLPASRGEVKAFSLADVEGANDNDTDAFNRLVKYLDKPI